MDASTRRHEWPQWQAQDLSRIFPTLGAEGVDLMRKMLDYDPAKRVSVRAAAMGTGILHATVWRCGLCMDVRRASSMVLLAP